MHSPKAVHDHHRFHIRNVANQVKKYAANAFVIVVSNPLDAIGNNWAISIKSNDGVLQPGTSFKMRKKLDPCS